MEVLFDKAGMAGALLNAGIRIGSFGASLSLESLKSIGVLTQNMVKNAQFIREGALTGVIRYLCTQSAAKGVERLALALKIVPLSGTPTFERHFLERIEFSDY